jgi:hypothetical protein
MPIRQEIFFQSSASHHRDRLKGDIWVKRSVEASDPSASPIVVKSGIDLSKDAGAQDCILVFRCPFNL